MGKNQDKKFQLSIKQNRTFSEAFKRAKVKELMNKRISIAEFSRLYQVSRTTVYKWLYLYGGAEKGSKMVVQMDSEANKTKLLQQQLAEYERIIGQKQLQIDLLEKGFELASLELGYDLKKKYVQRPLNGSDDTPTNTSTT
jgi:transposase